jgi:hypothetical protein
VSLATDNSGSAEMPRWARAGVPLTGDRSARRMFRLPTTGGAWAQRWLYSRPDGFDCVSAAAIANASTQSTTTWRQIRAGSPIDADLQAATSSPPNASGDGELDVSGTAVGAQTEATWRASISSHYFLVPYGSINGVVIGFGFMVVTRDLDRNINASSQKETNSLFGRFVMDEATGEVFITAFREDNTMFVCWTASANSCERIREAMLFKSPSVDGTAPSQVLYRSSFFQRRDCRMCSDTDAHSVDFLNSPCCGSTLRRDRVRVSGQLDLENSWSGFNASNRRFNGRYWGVVEKCQYDRTNFAKNQAVQVPILLDVRNGTAFLSQRLKDILQHSALCFGLGPRSSSRVFFVNRITAQAAYSSNAVRSTDSSERRDVPCSPSNPACLQFNSGAQARSPAVLSSTSLPSGITKRPRVNELSTSSSSDGGAAVRRVRNLDSFPEERDTVLFERKKRNRASAAKANARRKALIEKQDAELERLRKIVPDLISRREMLAAENASLRTQIAAKRSLCTLSITPSKLSPADPSGLQLCTQEVNLASGPEAVIDVAVRQVSNLNRD